MLMTYIVNLSNSVLPEKEQEAEYNPKKGNRN